MVLFRLKHDWKRCKACLPLVPPSNLIFLLAWVSVMHIYDCSSVRLWILYWKESHLSSYPIIERRYIWSLMFALFVLHWSYEANAINKWNEKWKFLSPKIISLKLHNLFFFLSFFLTFSWLLYHFTICTVVKTVEKCFPGFQMNCSCCTSDFPLRWLKQGALR